MQQNFGRREKNWAQLLGETNYFFKIVESAWKLVYINFVWLLYLITVTEAHRDFEPFLSREGSPRPNRLNTAGNQALHIHGACSIMDAEEIPAGLNSL